MEKEKYEDAARRLKRLIKAIFEDRLVRISIDCYYDAMKTECLMELFSTCCVVINGAIYKEELAEMAWYGCNLELINSSYIDTTYGAVTGLYFDCRQFVKDLNV